MGSRPAGLEKRAYGRSAGLLTGAVGIAGVLTYAFFALASHNLSAADYGDIVILWSVLFIAASTLFRPIEQLLARTLAERDQAGVASGDALRSAAVIQSALSLAATAAALLARGPIERELFGGNEVLFWVLVASLAGFGIAYYARGFLAGRSQFRHYAALLLVEVGSRLGFAVAVGLGIAAGASFLAVGIATAPVACAIVLPLAIRARARNRPQPGTPAPTAQGATELTLGRGGAFAGAVLVMMLSEQVLINSGALFVRAAEDAAAAGFIFNVMMVARAPLVLFQAIAASLLPHLAKIRTSAEAGSTAVFRSSVNSTLALIAAFAALTTLAVLTIGPDAMQIAFGEKFTYDRAGLAIVAVGMGLYLAAAALNQAALAAGQATRAAVRWLLAAAVFIAVNVSGVLDADRAVEIGFAVAAGALCLMLAQLYRHPSDADGAAIEPGSPRELQAQLTATDEVP